LVDLTLDQEYAAICGFTISEFDNLFKEHMEETLTILKSGGILAPEATISDLRDLILDWYDGYSWDGKTHVLNPWSLINIFRKKEIDDYWTQSGGQPSFLIKLIQSGQVSVKSLIDEKSINNSVNVVELGQKFKPIPLLFQAGYLTVTEVKKGKVGSKYILDIPNAEVRASLIPFIVSLEPIEDPLTAKIQCDAMLKALVNLDSEGVQKNFGSFLAGFSFSIHERHEAYYHTLFQAAMLMAEAIAESEGSVGNGKFDLRYEARDDLVFVIEIKYVPSKDSKGRSRSKEELKKEMNTWAQKAIKQIEDQGYTKAYQKPGRQIYQVGLVVGDRTEVLVIFKKE
jgi:hypothetical protein